MQTFDLLAWHDEVSTPFALSAAKGLISKRFGNASAREAQDKMVPDQ
jgi:hypothetical protein